MPLNSEDDKQDDQHDHDHDHYDYDRNRQSSTRQSSTRDHLPRDGRSTAKWALFFGVAAFCVSVGTCLLVLVFVIDHDRELARRDIGYTERLAKIQSLAESDHTSISVTIEELSAVKNWLIAVYERADAKGWNLPPAPTSKGGLKK